MYIQAVTYVTEGQRLIQLFTFFQDVYCNTEDYCQNHAVLEQPFSKGDQKNKTEEEYSH